MIPRSLQNIDELSGSELTVLCDLWTQVFVAALNGSAKKVQGGRADLLVKNAERIADEAVATFRGFAPRSPEARSPVDLLAEQMQGDPSYAWSWHCNLAMMAVDAGADRVQANLYAADFMARTFGVDPRLDENWKLWRLSIEDTRA